jgi:hypothetical protein
VGRKHWKVYRPTRLYPLEQGKDAQSAEKPVQEPIWDNILEDGGALYIPRGWWHVVYPVDEPTLHLTVGLRNHRGLDFLLWFIGQLRNCLEVRQDIPHLADQTIQTAYMKELRDHLLSKWSDDLLDRFLASSDANAILRADLQLPDAATSEGIVVHSKSRVRLSGSRRANLSGKIENGSLKFKYAGKILRCSEGVLPALVRLNDGQFHEVQELTVQAPDQKGSVLNFLQVLVMDGILTVAGERDRNFASVPERTQ